MNRKGRTMRDPAYRGCVNLTAMLAEIPPEARLDAVAMFRQRRRPDRVLHKGRIPTTEGVEMTQQATVDLPEGLNRDVANAVTGVVQNLAVIVRQAVDEQAGEVKLAQDADQRMIDLSRDLSRVEGRVMELSEAANEFLSQVEQLLAQHPEPKHGDDRYGYLRAAARNFYAVLSGGVTADDE